MVLVDSVACLIMVCIFCSLGFSFAFTCLSVFCLSVCPSVHPSICLSIYVCPSVCLYMYVHLSVCLSVSVHLSVCLSVHPSIRLFVCIYVCPSVHLSVCPSVCLSIHPSVCLSVYMQGCPQHTKGMALRRALAPAWYRPAVLY